MKNTLIVCASCFLMVLQLLAQNGHARVPVYRSDRIVVRINPYYLNRNMVDNPGIQKANLHAVLNMEGKKEVNKLPKVPMEIPNLKVRKLFPDLSVCDSISISRTGDRVKVPPFWATFEVERPPQIPMSTFMRTLREAKPLVVYAHPVYLLEHNDVPNDSLYADQHSLSSGLYAGQDIDIDSAWMIETGKKHIKVAVFDSGIDSLHEDLNLLTGYEYSSSYNDEQTWGIDRQGHGTSVAGIIAARRNNGLGIAGIAGGDGTDSTGVSLLDFKIFEPETITEEMDLDAVSVGLINASRSVGSYYTWPFMNQAACAFGFPGYGIHIANHSYGVRFQTIPIDTVYWEPPDFVLPCDLCYESYLFALQNGVINVAARGNGFNLFGPDFTGKADVYPANYPDDWVISVGATGYDGEWMHGLRNGNGIDNKWYSFVGRNLDLLAPGNATTVTTTASHLQYPDSLNYKYHRFNGTSAAAPHVSGVAALMLSYYNKSCYSNTNLDPADVEYILQASATDLNVPGYDDTTGWGRLNAHKALQMIRFPENQIIHPNAAPIQTDVLARDTIHFYLGTPLSEAGEYLGPLGANFVQQEVHYQVLRVRMQLVYDFSAYLLPTTQIKGLWLRPGRTNSIGFTADTTGHLAPIGTTGQYYWQPEASALNIEPQAQITGIDSLNGQVILEGYYYYFLNSYDSEYFDNKLQSINRWYPINPFNELPKMAYSLYLSDANFTARYDFPCDSLNPLIDSNLLVPDLPIHAGAFDLLPNPGSDQLEVRLQHLQPGKHVLRLMNAQGHVLQQEALATGNKNVIFDTAVLAPGFYVVEWQHDARSIQSKKWIKL